MKARPPALYAFVDATTSWLPAGPTTARTLEFDLNDCATRTANAVSTPSCVSPYTMRIFVRL
jgi:hypothetical protein